MTDDEDRSVPGKGLINGLAVTLKTMTRRSTTQQYPDVQPDLPPRSRGVIALLEENCTVCMLCARECPDWCIYIDSHKEEVVVPGAARPRQHNVLDKFDIDFSLCMYCGICIEVCPFDALHWTPEFEYSETDVLNLLHDKDRLGDWMQTVPPPPAHDVLGEPSKEEAAAIKKAAKPATPKPAASVRATPAPPAPTTAPPERPASATPQPITPPPAEEPGQAKAEAPGNAKSEAPGQAKAEAPGEAPAEKRAEEPGEATP